MELVGIEYFRLFNIITKCVFSSAMSTSCVLLIHLTPFELFVLCNDTCFNLANVSYQPTICLLNIRMH